MPTRDLSLGTVTSAGSSTGRQLEDRFRDMIHVEDEGALANDSAADGPAVASAVTKALAANKGVYFSGICRSSIDIPNFHNVRKYGPGGVRATSGRVWRAEPSPLVNNFSNRQTIYVDPALGNDANAGLGPGALAVASLPAAEAILSIYGYLPGTWSVTLAAGEYVDKAQFFAISNTRGNPLYIEGPSPASAWDNTAAPANADTTGGSVPTAILRPILAQRGAGSGIALDFNYDLNVVLQNIKARDWGVNTITGNEGFAQVRGRGWMRLVNCHVWNSGWGACGRDFSDVSFQGGIYHGNRQALYAVASSRYDTGIGATGAAQTTAALFRQNAFGIDLWEGVTGHPDYAIWEDNGTHIYSRKGSHVALRGPTFRNTGGFGSSVGLESRDNANFNFDGTEVWTGTHTRRVVQFNGAVDVNESSYHERWLSEITSDQTTSGTTQLQLRSLAIPVGVFVHQPQSVLAKIYLNATNPNATFGVNLRANGVLVDTLTLPINAGTGIVYLELLHKGADRSNTQFLSMHYVRSNSGGTGTQVAMRFLDATIDFTTAAQTLTFNMTAGNAADSITAKSVRVGRRG